MQPCVGRERIIILLWKSFSRETGNNEEKGKFRKGETYIPVRSRNYFLTDQGILARKFHYREFRGEESRPSLGTIHSMLMTDFIRRRTIRQKGSRTRVALDALEVLYTYNNKGKDDNKGGNQNQE